MSGNSSLAVLRSLVRELRLRTNGKLLDRPLMQWILSEYRSNRVTEEQSCRRPKEMTFLADTYFQYLRSQRLCNELLEKNQKREKTTRETAAMVGFKLPQSSTPHGKKD